MEWKLLLLVFGGCADAQQRKQAIRAQTGLPPCHESEAKVGLDEAETMEEKTFSHYPGYIPCFQLLRDPALAALAWPHLFPPQMHEAVWSTMDHLHGDVVTSPLRHGQVWRNPTAAFLPPALRSSWERLWQHLYVSLGEVQHARWERALSLHADGMALNLSSHEVDRGHPSKDLLRSQWMETLYVWFSVQAS